MFMFSANILFMTALSIPGVHHGKMQAGGLSDLQLSTLFDRMTIHFNDSYVIKID